MNSMSNVLSVLFTLLLDMLDRVDVANGNRGGILSLKNEAILISSAVCVLCAAKYQGPYKRLALDKSSTAGDDELQNKEMNNSTTKNAQGFSMMGPEESNIDN